MQIAIFGLTGCPIGVQWTPFEKFNGIHLFKGHSLHPKEAIFTKQTTVPQQILQNVAKAIQNHVFGLREVQIRDHGKPFE